MSRTRSKKAPKVSNPALTIVPAEVPSKPVPHQNLNIVPEDNVTPQARMRLPQSEVFQQLLQDVLMKFYSSVRQIAEVTTRYLGQVKVRRATKRLTVRESVSLGDKRFVAIVQVDGQQFLLGGAPNSVSMLAQLSGDQPASEQSVPAFAQALRRQCEADRNLA